MEKIINTLIDSSVQGADTYTHNDSTWLIFTESKQWVIELTGYKTLWYNYNFFKNIFAYVSLDAVQNQHLITKWVEDNVMNKVEDIHFRDARDNKHQFEDTLKNGVRHTENGDWDDGDWLDDILQEGVRDTFPNSESDSSVDVEDTIQNGVRDTQSNPYANESWIKGVIKNGIKETCLEQNITEGEVEGIIENGIKSSNVRQYVLTQIIDETIENGIKETFYDVYNHKHRAEGVIKNGVKETKGDSSQNPMGKVNKVVQNGIKETKKLNEGVVDWVGDIIDNGVIEIKPLPEQSGELRGYGDYYNLKEDRTKPFNDYLNDTLEMGVKIK